MLNHVLQLHCAIFYSLNYFNDTYFFCKYKNVRDILAQFTIMMPLMMETCNILYSSLILVLLLFLAHTTNAHIFYTLQNIRPGILHYNQIPYMHLFFPNFLTY